jgi:hypothetical protein
MGHFTATQDARRFISRCHRRNGHADRITQETIDKYLGAGYSVANADTVDGNENGRDTLKLVTLRVPAHIAAADVAAKLKTIPGATEIVVPEREYSSLDEARKEFRESDKQRAVYQAERKKLDEKLAKDEDEADNRRSD